MVNLKCIDKNYLKILLKTALKLQNEKLRTGFINRKVVLVQYNHILQTFVSNESTWNTEITNLQHRGVPVAYWLDVYATHLFIQSF